MAPSILLVGLPWDHQILKDAGENQLAIKDGMAKTQQLMTAAGYDYSFCWIGPEDTLPLVEKLQSKKWDGVVIGFGVRGNPGLTVFFEKLVNMVGRLDLDMSLGTGM